MPDPFLYAVILTIIVFFMGIFLNGDTPLNMVYHWGDGFWSFLAFGMQMTLVIVFGQALATAPAISSLLNKLADRPKTPKQAIMWATLVACVAMYINWGVGLIVGAIYSKLVAKRIRNVDYRLLLAASYSTMVMLMPSCTVLLKAASDPAELVKATNGVLTEIIPLTETVWSPLMNILMIVLLVTLPFVSAMLHPDPEHTVSIDPALLESEDVVKDEKIVTTTPAEAIEHFAGFNILIFIMCLIVIYRHFIVKGLGLDINMMNFLLMTFGIILHKRPANYIRACQEATSGAGGVILQFPFYGGIMGMMNGLNAEGVNLAQIISGAFVSVSTKGTLPLFAFFTAAILNFFVPSSGGLWAVQAPFMFPAAQALGVSYPLIAMAIGIGETWTNVIQPFWALPMLGIAGLKIRDIMGFCTILCIYEGVILVLGMIIGGMVM